jgi:hypothetical protein
VSVQTAADSLRITRDAYQQRENGQQKFAAEELVVLCELLDVLPSYFFEQLDF